MSDKPSQCADVLAKPVADFFPRTRRAYAIGELLAALEETSLIAKIFTNDVRDLKTEDEGLKLLTKELLPQLTSTSSRKWTKVLEVLLDPKHNSDACQLFLDQMADVVAE